jgi:hypothetical protein
VAKDSIAYTIDTTTTIDSTNIADTGVSLDNIHFGEWVINPCGPVGGAGPDGSGDSVRLELSSHDGNAFVLYRDSSMAGGGTMPMTDTAWIPFQMPMWADTLDSIIIIMKSKNASEDSAEISEVEIFEPSGTAIENSQVWDTTGSWKNATATRYAMHVNKAVARQQIFNVMIEHTLGTSAVGVVYVYRVFCKVSQ